MTTSADLHILILADGLRLVRRAGAWRDLQDEFIGYVSSIGPCGLEEALDLLFAEWPSLAWREAQIRAWALGGGVDFDLEGPAP